MKNNRLKMLIPFVAVGLVLIVIGGGVMALVLLTNEQPDYRSDYHDDDPGAIQAMKPVIYLYPPKTTKVDVRLDFDGTLIADYPSYDPTLHGWQVMAAPDGTLTNVADGKEYSYIFWEGAGQSYAYDATHGFVVKGEDTAQFLRTTLSQMGLTAKEYNEFIVYWYPKMKNNPYNYIYFAGDEYTQKARLAISPQPDSLLRVFMMYKSLSQPIVVQSQAIQPFKRTGFAVVEWGGSEIR